MAFTYDYPRPMVTVDVVLLTAGEEAGTGKDRQVLLIRRGQDPFKGQWALPGGFLDLDEELEVSAARELFEETGVEIPSHRLKQIGAFGDLGRDPRGRTVNVAYLAVIDSPPAPCAGDDAAEAQWFEIRGLPEMAFDHGQIVERAQGMQ